jgi:hypothetical protein
MQYEKHFSGLFSDLLKSFASVGIKVLKINVLSAKVINVMDIIPTKLMNIFLMNSFIRC